MSSTRSRSGVHPSSSHLMRRSSYLGTLNKLKAKYGWLADSLFEPAPGHFDVIKTLCRNIDSIISLSNDRFAFFRIVNHDGCLQIYVEHRTTYSHRIHAMDDSVEHCKKKSLSICPACGSDLHDDLNVPRTRQYWCESHTPRRGLFHEDYEGAALPEDNQTDKDAMTILKAIGFTQIDDADLKEMEINPLASDECEFVNSSLLEIRLFDLEKYLKFKRAIDTRYKDHQPRLRAAAEKMDQLGSNLRRLTLLKKSWPKILTEFTARFPNFEQVAELFNDHFSLSVLGDGRISFPPILLVGEPGIGKTEAARWLAEKLAIPFRVLDMASTQTSATISGSDSSWSNSESGAVFEMLAFERSVNPIIVLDEIDKVSSDLRFNPLSPLYSLLESQSARKFVDLAIRDLPIDASHINWIATCNCVDNIPKAILSRFVVFRVPSPNAEQIKSIAQNIFTSLCSESLWGEYFSQELSADVKTLLSQAAPRTIKLLLKRALGSAARESRNTILAHDINIHPINRINGIGFLAEMH